MVGTLRLECNPENQAPTLAAVPIKSSHCQVAVERRQNLPVPNISVRDVIFTARVAIFGVRDVIFGVRDVIFGVRDVIFAVRDVIFAVRDVIFGVRDVIFAVRDVIFAVRDVIFTVRDVIFTVRDVIFAVPARKCSGTGRTSASCTLIRRGERGPGGSALTVAALPPHTAVRFCLSMRESMNQCGFAAAHCGKALPYRQLSKNDWRLRLRFTRRSLMK